MQLTLAPSKSELLIRAEELRTQLIDAYDSLKSLTIFHDGAQVALQREQSILRAERDEIILKADPADLGKNEAMREAKLRQLTASQVDIVAEAQDSFDKRVRELRHQAIVVEGLRAELRLLEATTQLFAGGDRNEH